MVPYCDLLRLKFCKAVKPSTFLQFFLLEGKFLFINLRSTKLQYIGYNGFASCVFFLLGTYFSDVFLFDYPLYVYRLNILYCINSGCILLTIYHTNRERVKIIHKLTIKEEKLFGFFYIYIYSKILTKIL